MLPAADTGKHDDIAFVALKTINRVDNIVPELVFDLALKSSLRLLSKARAR